MCNLVVQVKAIIICLRMDLKPIQRLVAINILITLLRARIFIPKNNILKEGL